MAEEFKIRFRTVFRNVLPAIVVMAAGLVGTYLVYNNYLSDRTGASEVSGLEPAAGGDETITAAPAAEEKIAPAAAPAGTTATTTTGGAAVQKVYNDEGEDSGNGPDTATAPASGTTTPPATGTAATPANPDAPVKATPDATQK